MRAELLVCLFLSCLGLNFFSCQPAAPANPSTPVMTPSSSAVPRPSRLSPAQLYDKVLGALVGSAIGDAMGAPTEMWNRFNMQVEYGHIDSLDDLVREPSAEGTWGMNLPAGSTTDDTRWKVLMIDFLTGDKEQAGPRPSQLSATAFTGHIQQRYERGLQELRQLDAFALDPYEDQMRKIAWLKEWALVAKPYQEGEIDGYSDALNKFYGGEMVCAGMLFSPLVGAAYPGDPAWAYEQSFNIDVFDIGYAKDIAGLSAAMVSAAMSDTASQDSILRVMREVDPKGYFNSRLVGRTSYKLFQEARYIVHEAREAKAEDIVQNPPVKLALPLETSDDSIRYARISRAYQLLDEKLMRYPFHPAEIHLVNVTAMMLCDFDFRTSLAFVINYGRDNDTTAAVTGSILGALHGFEALPEDLRTTVLTANRELGFDLETLAQRLTQSIQASTI
ncbi:MAG: ADP-ribosylglycohydrolase family protein [Bacteroidota bacterium]